MLAVSFDPPATSEALRRRLGLDVRFLSDERGVLMDALGIRHRGARPAVAGAGSRDLFLATTFLLDETHTIRWVYRPATYRVRASVDDILRAIDALGPPPG